MSRHNVVYIEACSFDSVLGGFVPGTKLSQYDFRAEFAISYSGKACVNLLS